jgi:hypothetical protein
MIVSAQTGGTVRLASTYFQNVGGLIIGGTSNLLIDDASFENLGGMSIASGGSVDVSLSEHEGMPDAPSVPFVNSGTIRSYGGNITEIAAGGLLTAVPLVNSSTGTIVGFGNINAPISNSGTILSSYASTLDIAGPVTGTGTLEVNSGCVLELGASVDASQTIVFEGPLATVRLNSPLGFTGSVEGFQSGDAFDITGPSVDNVSIVNGRLLIGTSNGSLAISSKSALAGELSVGKDVHGGHVVAYTAQSPGSGVGGESQVTISVSQPQMLFWASPVGDTFAGTSSNLNGATIANWTTADTLDLTDFLPSAVSLAYTQSTTSGTLVITEGAHSADITFTGIYHSSWFGVAPDQHGGTLITYSH